MAHTNEKSNENIKCTLFSNTELAQQLKAEYLTSCKNLQQKNNLSDITKFATELNELSNEYDDNDLKDFANDLINATGSFDIKRIKKSLIHFIEKVEQISD